MITACGASAQLLFKMYSVYKLDSIDAWGCCTGDDLEGQYGKEVGGGTDGEYDICVIHADVWARINTIL